jgi:hypothetical protein
MINLKGSGINNFFSVSKGATEPFRGNSLNIPRNMKIIYE